MNTSDYISLEENKKLFLIFALFLIGMTFVAYLPAMGGGFIWDDDAHVWANPHMFAPDGLYRIWFTRESQQYYPLVYSSFWLEWRIWGDNPMGYHVVNVFLHSINAILVYLILARLKIRGAWAVALIFAVHPVHVESVAWISERKNVLSGLFYLLSFLSFLNFEDGRGRKWYIISLALFIPGLLCKTVICTLPGAFFLVRWLRGRLDIKFLAGLVPFLIIGGFMGLVTVWWEVNQVGAEGGEWSITALERSLLPARIAWFYAYKLLLPFKLIFTYPRFDPNPALLWQWLFPAGLVAIFAALYFLKDRIGKGPVAAAAFFVMTLFPALGFFDVYPFRFSFVADHFQYLASLGLITLAVAVATWLLRRVDQKAGFAVLGALLVLLSVLTWRQALTYENRETIWLDVLSKNPNAWIAHNNLGGMAYEEGRPDEAMAHYEKALALWPMAKEVHYNMGASYLARGELDKAEYHLKEVLKITPNVAKAYSELSLVYAYKGRYEESYKNGLKAVMMTPADEQVQNSFGIALVTMDRAEDALEHYRLAISIRPDFVEAYNNLGVAMDILNRPEEALRYFNKAVQIRPAYAEAYYNIGVTLQGTGNLDQAKEAYENAIRNDNAHYKAVTNLANTYYLNGDYDTAIKFYREALRINPDFQNARHNLEIAVKAKRP